MKTFLLFFLVVLILSCNSSSEAEEILDAGIIAGIDMVMFESKHDLNYSRSHLKVKPIMLLFKDEVKNKTDLALTLYAIDTLLANRKFADDYVDSLYSEIIDQHSSLIRRKTTIMSLLHSMHYIESYMSHYCNTERIKVLQSDTIYYPRNREFSVNQLISYRITDTLQKLDTRSTREFKNSNIIKISTHTLDKYLKIPLMVDLQNPVTKELRKYKDTLIVVVVD